MPRQINAFVLLVLFVIVAARLAAIVRSPTASGSPQSRLVNRQATIDDVDLMLVDRRSRAVYQQFDPDAAVIVLAGGDRAPGVAGVDDNGQRHR